MIRAALLAFAAGALSIGCSPIVGIDELPGRDGAAADACGADLSADPKNCGACGHDCLGGECQGGACQPFPVAAGVCPAHVAVAPPFLYYSDECASGSPQIVACENPPGCTTLTTMAYVDVGPVAGLTLGIADRAGDPGIFWSVASLGDTYVCPAPGGCPFAVAQVFVAGAPGVGPMADAQGVLYEALDTDGGGGVDWNDPVHGTAGGWGPWGAVLALAAEQSLVAWTDKGGVHVCQPQSNCQLTTLNPTTACGAGCTNQSSQGLALTTKNLVWTSAEGVFTCALPCGGAPTLVYADGASGPVVADDAYIYWYGALGSLYRCPLGPCTQPTVMAAGVQVGELAEDSTALYFTTGGPIMMLAK